MLRGNNNKELFKLETKLIEFNNTKINELKYDINIINEELNKEFNNKINELNIIIKKINEDFNNKLIAKLCMIHESHNITIDKINDQVYENNYQINKLNNEFNIINNKLNKYNILMQIIFIILCYCIIQYLI